MEGKARTRPDIFRVVLGPYVQYCPCEASEQKLEQKPISGLKEIELSYCHYSICLQKTSVSKKERQNWHLAYFVPINGRFGQMFWDINFKFVLPIIYINFDIIQTKFEVNQTQIGHSIPKKSKNLPKWPYLKTPFCPSVIHQKAYLSDIFLCI